MLATNVKIYSYWCETLAHILSFYASSAFYINLVINTLFLYYISVYGRQQVVMYVSLPSHRSMWRWQLVDRPIHIAAMWPLRDTDITPFYTRPPDNRGRVSYFQPITSGTHNDAGVPNRSTRRPHPISKSLLRPYRQTHNKIIIK